VSGFGDKFKSARQLRGVTLDDIARETRISTRFLRAIEEEAFDELPGGLFNRGFIRNYAAAVHLDGDAMVEAYTALTAAVPEETPKPQPGASPSRDRFVLPLAAAGLAVLVFVFYVFSSRSGDSPTTEMVQAGPAAAAMRSPETASTGEPATTLPFSVPAGLPDDAEGTDAMDAALLESQPALSAESAPGAQAGLLPVAAGRDTAPGRDTPPAGASGEAPDAVSGLSVRVEVHDPTWMYVESDGEVVLGGVTVNPPFLQLYQANEAIELRIGNAAGVSLNINGHAMPALGGPNEVWSRTITPENVGRLTGS